MKIALVGAHRATKLVAPYDDPGWAIWSCSPKNESELPRVDAWFEMHSPEAVERQGPVYIDWLRALPLVWMRERFTDIPGCAVYPIAAVIDAFENYFLSGTVSYMLAKAILDEPEEIGLWGVADCPEYKHQKPSLWFFAHQARARGIPLNAPMGVFDPPPLYGYDDA